MSDTNTTDTTATKADRKVAAIIVAHAQAAIPSPLWTENQRLGGVIAELRAELAAATARAEAAEAKLATVPVRIIAKIVGNAVLWLTSDDFNILAGWYEAEHEAQLGDEDEQSEVQP